MGHITQPLGTIRMVYGKNAMATFSGDVLYIPKMGQLPTPDLTWIQTNHL